MEYSEDLGYYKLSYAGDCVNREIELDVVLRNRRVPETRIRNRVVA
jgi:hypothetical protein